MRDGLGTLRRAGAVSHSRVIPSERSESRDLYLPIMAPGISRGGRGAVRQGSYAPPRPAEDAEQGGEISPPDHQRIGSRGWRGTVRMCIDLDREAVLRVSFLRGLRVLRVKLRRARADRGSSLWSPCSL
jgi:hypothetical protein